MARVIPGVEVKVIKEVVPPQLAPSGVLGLVGLAAPARAPRKRVERVGSWARFRELYGRASALAMPEAQLALQNGVFELVVVDLESSVAQPASASFPCGGLSEWLQLRARAKGTAFNGLVVVLTPQRFRGEIQAYELRVRDGEADLEVHRNLSLFPGDARYIGDVLKAADSVLEVIPPSFSLTKTPISLGLTSPRTTVVTLGTQDAPLDLLKVAIKTEADEPASVIKFSVVEGEGGEELCVQRDALGDSGDLLRVPADAPDLLVRVRDALSQETELEVEVVHPAIAGTRVLADGVDASVAEYASGLAPLEDVPDVDMVIASVQDLDLERAASIYGAVIAHCVSMSADAKGRLGFGQVPFASNIGDHVELVGPLVSDRFVLFAPHGVLGAAVGRIGSLDYYRSPTFKSLSGLGVLEPSLRIEEQREYLRHNIVPVAELPDRGNAIVRGLTTDGDQISVRRIADRAVRGVRKIGELFIGKLNTEDGRNALKQKLNEFLLQMQADNAIVPKTDGSDPAFKLAVHSSQADFAQGIVRVDLAVRPVRAIDYIYATVLVQV